MFDKWDVVWYVVILVALLIFTSGSVIATIMVCTVGWWVTGWVLRVLWPSLRADHKDGW